MSIYHISGATGSQSARGALEIIGNNKTLGTILPFGAVAAQSTAQFSLLFASIRTRVWMHEKSCATTFRTPPSFFYDTLYIITRAVAIIENIDNSSAATLKVRRGCLRACFPHLRTYRTQPHRLWQFSFTPLLAFGVFANLTVQRLCI